MKFEDLKGQTLESIEGCSKGSEQVLLTLSDGRCFRLYHDQSCCESVELEDVCGDISDLVGTPLLTAEESSNSDRIEGTEETQYEDFFTWTFYRLSTIKGTVTLRWYGTSNGYYSESVDFEEILSK